MAYRGLYELIVGTKEERVIHKTIQLTKKEKKGKLQKRNLRRKKMLNKLEEKGYKKIPLGNRYERYEGNRYRITIDKKTGLYEIERKVSLKNSTDMRDLEEEVKKYIRERKG